MSAFKNILNFNPTDYIYHIPKMSTTLNHLFVIANTSICVISTEEQLHPIVTSYSHICQPESWEQWFRNQIDDFEDGKITNPQEFMNQVSLKFYRICNTDTGLQGSYQTIT